MTTQPSIRNRRQLTALCLLLANVAALVIFTSIQPAAASQGGHVDACAERETNGCDCLPDHVWYPSGCYEGGIVWYCLDETRCHDDCPRPGESCRKPPA